MNTINNWPTDDNGKTSLTFRHCFRLVFTMFSLFLMVDVFWRWDAFKFHSAFSEYLPNVALALIIWSTVALLCSIIIWLLMKAFVRICGYMGLKIEAEHLMLYFFAFILLAALTWASKNIIWTDVQTSRQLKLAVIIFISCTAVPVTWLFRNKAGAWISEIQERITPLVWLFAFCLMLSLPFVAFQTWGGDTKKTTSQEFPRSTMSGADQKRPNILLVTFDAMTARDMSVYGYDRDTTPFIKKWANKASVFTRTQAASNGTAATIASLMTGKRVWTHRKYHFNLAAKPLKSDIENIALALREHGYHNSAFIQNIVASVEAAGISGSIDLAPSVIRFARPSSIEGLVEKYLFLLFGDKFSTYNWLGQDDFIFTILVRKIPQKVFETEFPAELVFNKFLEEMDKDPHKPFFAWVHMLPPHAPVSPPRPFAGTFNPSWELREKNIQYSFRPELNEYADKELPFPDEIKRKVKLVRDYYDEFILYCDNQFEQFIGELERRDWLNNTVIILSSDHGESFEHDYFTHNRDHLYEQVTHIPLIIKEPDQSVGRVIDDLVEQIDISATILDFADIPVPSWMEGRSLLPLLSDEGLPARPAMSLFLHGNVTTDPITKGSIALWEGDYKLIRYLEKDKFLMFNLKKDPDELINLFDKEPVVAQRLLDLIQSNLDKANKNIMADK